MHWNLKATGCFASYKL